MVEAHHISQVLHLNIMVVPEEDKTVELKVAVLVVLQLELKPQVMHSVKAAAPLHTGSAAVEAAIVSPVVLIVVAIAGIAGYTVPSQEFSAALRIWRFLLVIGASLGGLFAVTALTAVLVGRLAQLESFGVPYLAPFAPGQGKDGYGVLRWPTHRVKFREAILHTRNRRRQG